MVKLIGGIKNWNFASKLKFKRSVAAKNRYVAQAHHWKFSLQDGGVGCIEEDDSGSGGGAEKENEK